MLQPSDEHWHEPTQQAHWSESFYFNAFDTDAGWACAIRVGISPNAGTRDGFICLYLPDQTTGFVRMSERLGDERAAITVGGIALHCVEPFRRWSLTYDGPIHHYERAASSRDILRTLDAGSPTRRLALELDVQAVSPAIDYHDRSVRMRPVGEMLGLGNRSAPLATIRRTLRALGALPAMMDAHHYEQSMSVRGAVTVDGERHPVAGHGQRDHSWGVRDMSVPASWRWVSCQFENDLCFNATQVDVLGMRVQSGFVHQGGQTDALQGWGFEAKHGTSPYWPDSLDLHLTTKSGRRLAFDVEVRTPLPVVADPDTRDVLVTAARAEYRWEGRLADGMVEFMERLP